ncbi:hypothetical protein ACHAXS_005702 [Conticribra weissflogii]
MDWTNDAGMGGSDLNSGGRTKAVSSDSLCWLGSKPARRMAIYLLSCDRYFKYSSANCRCNQESVHPYFFGGKTINFLGTE